MKFLITATPKQLELIKIDLDKEKKKAQQMQKRRAWSRASKLLQRVTKMPLVLLIDYKERGNTQIELMIGMTAEMYISKKWIEREIKKRFKYYGEGIKVEVL